ncbi:hypothetical protein ABS755_10345 [Castellaniella sp. FW104-16D08]
MPKRIELRLQALERTQCVAKPLHNIFIMLDPYAADEIIAFTCDSGRIDRLPDEDLETFEARAAQHRAPSVVTLWCAVYRDQ